MNMKTEQPQPAGKTADIESGNQKLYPTMLEDPKLLRWTFIRKVYAILTMQLLLTIGVAVVVATVHPIGKFFLSTWPGFVLSIVFLVLPLLVLCPLFIYHHQHPMNILILCLFTVSIAFSVGICCLLTSWRVILETSILATVVTISLTLYTFWAAKKGHDFKFLGPFLFVSLLVLLIFCLIQIFHPLGKLWVMIHGCLGTILFSGYIIYDTDNLIKRYSDEDYIWASVGLYLDAINLFLSLFNIFRVS
ncbi:Bax inhibitor 1-related [Macleaya cordata]|uniref:Bax inhibitor 1-related n=1 Tax=Macleaya cordata TaxID=56857 RepID=A0A200QSZ0_MACCD|nr:Bax inhibitor 1-related [Macleaya cordata]